MPHEHDHLDKTFSHAIESYENEKEKSEDKNSNVNNNEVRRLSQLERTQSQVPHLYAEIPQVVTHHHDTDDEESDHDSNHG